MPQLTLHPLSVVIGLALAGLVALTTSQASPPPTTLVPAAIRIEYMPHPRDMVQIKEGTPYTVPTGKLFVLTGLGFVNGFTNCLLLVNGQVEFGTNGSLGNGSPVVAVPAGFTALAGATIELNTGSSANFGRAWGYLASQ